MLRNGINIAQHFQIKDRIGCKIHSKLKGVSQWPENKVHSWNGRNFLLTRSWSQ